MNDLSNHIYQYYCGHFDELPFDKQLHFASRLFLWSNDDFGTQQLRTLRSEVTANEHPVEALRQVYTYAQNTIHHGSKNAAELRAPYFEKYPSLRGLAMVLFRLTFMDTIYGLDGREELFNLFPENEIETLLAALLADEKALAMLSTHAINVLYLYNRVVKDNEDGFDPTVFLGVGHKQYDLSDPIHLQLYIYLYTHCIIGESKFYARKLPERFLPVYRQMIHELEEVIASRFTEINLDNKFEFLVCCKLVGVPSSLTERIETEAQASISNDGTFLVDRHNSNPQAANTTLDLSEHRNVLYILAHREAPESQRPSLAV